MIAKDFDCVEWVRDIRQKEYAANKHLSLQEYVEKMTNEVQNSVFYKEVILDRGVQVVSPSLAKQ